MRCIHFISGYPRSGSTLLAAILRQNPLMHAGMSSGCGQILVHALNAMGATHEYSASISRSQRANILRGIVEGYYADLPEAKIIFDTNRMWCSRLPLLDELYPQARLMVCVRDLPWVVDSIERLVRREPLIVSRMFSPETAMNVFTRAEHLTGPRGMVGFPVGCTQEAFFGEHSRKLIVVDYDALTTEPEATMAFVYHHLGLPPFPHDFDNVTYEGGREFDEQFGMPELHKIRPKVERIERQTVLPPDLFNRYSGKMFWRDRRHAATLAPVIAPAAAMPAAFATTALASGVEARNGAGRAIDVAAMSYETACDSNSMSVRE
jgi:sulfotransferase